MRVLWCDRSLRQFLEKIVPVKPKTADLDSRLRGNDGGIFFARKRLRRILQVRHFLRQNGSFHRTDLQTNAAINAGGKINPVPIRSLGIFPRPLVNASHWAGIYAIGNAFADIRDNRMRHSSLYLNQ